MIFRPADDYWEQVGATEPYWAVLTDDKYRSINMTAENRQLFFQSGESHVAHVFRTIRAHLKPDFKPTMALDFGCGVGRVAIALSQQVAHTVGVDVAPSMLVEAKSNCRERGIDNVEFLQTGQGLDLLPPHRQFDFVHSVLVLQHIPVARGMQIFKRLLDHLQDDGVAAIHFLCWIKPRWPALRAFRNNLPFGYRIWAALRQLRSPPWPWGASGSRMEMHSYDLNTLLLIIREMHAQSFHVEILDDQATVGVMLYLRKPSGRDATAGPQAR